MQEHNDLQYDRYVKNFSEHAFKQIQEVVEKGGYIYTLQFSKGVTLSDYYLSLIAEDKRSHYQCRTCANFINKYGLMVSIDEIGNRGVIGWDLSVDLIPALFCNIHNEFIRLCMTEKIEGPLVFDPNEEYLGKNEKGGFHHMHIHIPPFAKVQQLQLLQAERFRNIEVLRDEYSYTLGLISVIAETTLNKARRFIVNKQVNQAEKFIFQIETLVQMKMAMSGLNVPDKTTQQSRLWKLFVERYTVFSGFKNTVVGEFLSDLENEREVGDIEAIKRFNFKVRPDTYMRPEAPPTDDLVDQATKLIEELGLEKSFERRHATLKDIQKFITWKPEKIEKVVPTKGLFDKLKNNDSQKATDINLPVLVTMTYEKFKEKIIPTAVSIKFTPGNFAGFCNLVTAVHEDAKPILRYDKEENRNPVSILTYRNHNALRTELWNLKSGTEVEVIAVMPIITNYNTGESNADIFILKDCYDNRTLGLGLFPEIVLSALYPVRKVIEQFSNTTDLTETEEKGIAGLALSRDIKECNYLFKVKDKDGVVKTILIDRGE